MARESWPKAVALAKKIVGRYMPTDSDLNQDEVEKVAVQIRDALYEIDHWREIALWLADCHAATAVTLLERKSTSKYERTRQANICKIAAQCLEAGAPISLRSRDLQDVVRRLKELPTNKL